MLPADSEHWLEPELRQWLRTCKPQPSKLIYLLRKSGILSEIDIPGSSADITTEGKPPMSGWEKLCLIKEEYKALTECEKDELDAAWHIAGIFLAFKRFLAFTRIKCVNRGKLMKRLWILVSASSMGDAF